MPPAKRKQPKVTLSRKKVQNIDPPPRDSNDDNDEDDDYQPVNQNSKEKQANAKRNLFPHDQEEEDENESEPEDIESEPEDSNKQRKTDRAHPSKNRQQTNHDSKRQKKSRKKRIQDDDNFEEEDDEEQEEEEQEEEERSSSKRKEKTKKTHNNAEEMDQVEEEEEIDPVERFVNEQRKYDERRARLQTKTKQFKKKSENPLRAELYSIIRKFVKTDITSLKKYLPDINFEQFLKENNKLTPAENRTSKLLKIVEYILSKDEADQSENDLTLSLMCALQTRVAKDKKESLQWSAIRLGPNASGLKSSQQTEKELKQFGKQWTTSLRDRLAQGDDETIHGWSVQQHHDKQFVYVAATILNVLQKKTRGRNVEVQQVETTVVAFNPTFEFMFFHGSPTKELLMNLTLALNLGFAGYISCELKDMGLTSVYTSCKKSVTTATKASLKRNLNERENELKDLNVDNYTFQDDQEKKRKIMADLIDDRQEGGFQTLTFKFIPEGFSKDYPIGIRFTTKQGNMDKAFAEMVREGAIADPTMYMMARDKKSNLLTKNCGKIVNSD